MKTTIKIISSLVLFLTLSSQSFAQHFLANTAEQHTSSIFTGNYYVGVRGGINFSTMTEFPLLASVTPSFKYLAAPTSAIFAEFGVNDRLAIRPEVSWTQKGFSVKESVKVLGIPLPLGVSLRTNYIEVPILAKINLGQDNEATHAYLLIGPSVGYLASTRYSIDLGVPLTGIDLGSGIYKKFEFSGVAGVGVAVPMGGSQFFIEGRYQYGFTRVLDTTPIALSVRNRGFGVSVGYQIPF